MMKRKVLAFLTAAVASLILAPQAEATSYDLDYVFSGATPSSSSPYLTANFVQSGANVTLTLTGSLEAAAEFISNFYFNSTNATGALSTVSCTTCTVDSLSQYSPDAYGADGGGLYDFQIGFATAEGAGRFAGTDVAIFTIANATVSWFDTISAKQGGNGQWVVAAHLQGIPTNCSGWISDGGGTSGVGPGGTGPCTTTTVPDSGATLGLLGLAILGVGYLRRRVR